MLQTQDLKVALDAEQGLVKAIDGLTLAIARGETFALVGESGCGKSMTALALMRLLPDNGNVTAGRVMVGHNENEMIDVLGLPESGMRAVRGGRIGMIFQEPSTSLNPVMRVGEYPHQLSGGMRQRVMIALALACNPEVLIADEPTTALDVTVQAQILELIDKVKRDFDIGVILVTHDLGVVAETAQTVMVMYAGRAVEHGPAAEVFDRPQHPYTWGLLESMPSVEAKVSQLRAIEGSPPSVIQLPPGCPFHPRCPHRFDPCDKTRPPLETIEGGHADACHLDPDAKRRLWAERQAVRLGVGA